MNLNYVLINFSVILILSSHNIFAQTEKPYTKSNNESYAFNQGAVLISPGIGFVKGTKNNFGVDLELGISNTFGIVAGISKSTINTTNESFTGGGFGLRAHSIYSSRKQNFDIAPGIYWTKIFKIQNADAFSYGIDFRLFFEKQVGIGFGLSRGFTSSSTFGKSVSLIIKIN